ncbi:hypothetical protein [Roseimarinus sediminis]|uniref:hypothetical protein n=1 Tax=Roseimarinus sediminis TaxID=1610899 RepID=UPI003D230A94
MKKLYPILLAVIMLMFFSCGEDNDMAPQLNFEKIEGFVQKGPYLNGTTISIAELNSDLSPSGKIFTSQILDNKGSFEIRNVELTSQYVELMADGFYFNEVKNANSSARLTLLALSDLSNKSSLNVNVLSSLEKNRVYYLTSQGESFSDAKKMAQHEILSIFEIDKEEIGESEQLDISKPGDDNAILLAVSVILQGYLSVSELSELLANISTDIRDDGQLNSQALGSTLINNAKTINLAAIRSMLESRYELLGLNISVPDFESYVNQFIENTDFVFTGFIEYPATGKYGKNILDREESNYSPGTYSMKAVLPEGTNLKVKLGGQNWYFPAFQDNTGWEFSPINPSENSRIFTATRTGEIDFELAFGSRSDSTGTIYLHVYENDDQEATWTKEIEMN